MLGKLIAATDQLIGVGDGKQREFPLTKTYQAGRLSQVRRIHKPVENTVLIAVNHKIDPRFTVNTVNGLVTLLDEYDPPCSGDLITAGFELMSPVDLIPISYPSGCHFNIWVTLACH